MSVESNKQVRVDNWGVFFLQRLQMFFSKTDYCDLTLQFEGNVQLKVHRLVMNACTEYFDFLEKSCPALEENVILMPANLQADVIVPIVNFIYTGMLEFHVSMFDRLYKAADLMSISVLTKLLDAQKISMKKKLFPTTYPSTSSPSSSWLTQAEKKVSPKPVVAPVIKELPSALPGRKLPVWKRKVVPGPAGSPYSDRWSNSSSQDHQTSSSVSHVDNTPKPTRFEWPDEDLPSLSLMDTSVEEISFTSKPLVTVKDEFQPSTSFDHLRNSASNQYTRKHQQQQQLQQQSNVDAALDMEDIKDFIKEQKIRTELAAFEEHEEQQTNKRKLEPAGKPTSPKRSRPNDKETVITITSPNKSGNELDHNKIVADILKKYPHLVKNNKNIKIKIVAANNKATNSVKKSVVKKEVCVKKEGVDKWVCDICLESGEHMEFHIFYMYRKHMSEVHHETFEDSLCKCCGIRCANDNAMMYHLLTVHGVKAPKGIVFPTCTHCPHVAISNAALNRHIMRHDKNELQCATCQLAFSNTVTFTRHVQITNHDTKKDIYDCQFCTRKYNSPTNLFTHVKDAHLVDAKKDGVVIIEDLPEDLEAEEDDDEIIEEFAVSSDIARTNRQEKVNIISDLKVESPMRGRLEPSSEAEALSNVASGIATSLGLVDIVVLDENQQYILQQQQEQQQQPPTTDELVMVLTDHDYQDEQDQVDNSNIVVLYSHPVDGGEGQFITTSQANLADMGLLQIRNGNEESIEMIQREIDSHTNKEPNYFQTTTEHNQQFTEPMEVDEPQKDQPPPELNEKQEEEEEHVEEENKDGHDVTPDMIKDKPPSPPLPQEEIQEQPEEHQEEHANPHLEEHTNEHLEEHTNEHVEEHRNELEENPIEESEQFIAEAMEVDGKNALAQTEVLPEENAPVEETTSDVAAPVPEVLPEGKEDEPVENIDQNDTLENFIPNETVSTNENDDENQEKEETTTEVINEDPEKPIEDEEPKEHVEETEEDISQNETSNSQFNDDNSQSWQESNSKEVEEKVKSSILDDWEDTDSQQSEKQPVEEEEPENGLVNDAEERVSKLMDDWNEEEEEEGNEKNRETINSDNI